MKLFGYQFEFSSTAKWGPFYFNHTNRWNIRTIRWYKYMFRFGPESFCEECEKPVDLIESVCEECNEHYYCECGTRLEDSYGSPGDGFCTRCR